MVGRSISNLRGLTTVKQTISANDTVFSYCSNSKYSGSWECRFHTVLQKLTQFVWLGPFWSQAELQHQISCYFVFALC